MASLLFACSSESSRGPRVLEMHVRGGSRLRPVVLESDDGLQLSVGIHDRGLGVRCVPEAAADGVLRCLPPAQKVSDAFRYFADPRCKRPAYFIRDIYPHVPGYLLQGGGGELCTRRTTVLRTRTIDEVYSDTPEGCFRESNISAEEVVREVPASEFVALTPAGGPRIRSSTYEGRDGSRITIAGWGLSDAEFGVSCSPTVAKDGRERCLPESTVEPVGFTDATCSTSTWALSACATRFLFRTPSEPSDVLGAGEPVTTIFGGNESTCASVPLAPEAFRLGPAIEPSRFVEFRRTTFGGTRLRLYASELDGRVYPERSWRSRSFHDVELGEDCDLAEVSKDTYRCLPFEASGSVVYLDAECTRPGVEVAETAWTFVREFGVDSTKVYAVPPAAPREAEVFTRFGGTCEPRGRTSVVPVGSPIPLTSFPEVRRVIR